MSESLNPGLGEFDLSRYRGVSGLNFFESTPIIAEALTLNSRNTQTAYLNAVTNHLKGLGSLLGEKINDLTSACHRDGKWGELVQFDRFGNRIDEVRYSPEQVQLRKIFYDYGVVNLDCHESWKFEFSLPHRMALAILTNMNGEGGVACPLAMTEGLVHALRAIGTDDQKERFLPLLTDPKSNSHFMAGQYVTERVGGSNVGANRTIATPQANGTWLLNGEKWFCSNPGDVWVTTAKVAGTNSIGLFLVGRLKADNSLNGCKLLRKKDIIGSKGKITVESIYEDCEATALGRTTHGLANLIRYILKTSRLHVICGGLGHISRAVIEAEAYVAAREAYGKKLAHFPSVQKSLDEMRMLRDVLTLIAFKAFELAEIDHPLALMLVPLLKMVATQYSAVIVKEAMILHGGNGILGDFSVLPRLLNDAIINETWEGTHALLAEHTLAALKRSKVWAAFTAYARENGATGELDRLLADEREVDINRAYLCEKLWRIFGLGEVKRWIQTYPTSQNMHTADLFRRYVDQNARMPFRA